jgi:hypothetical protein
MREAGFEDQIVDDTLREALATTRARIKMICEKDESNGKPSARTANQQAQQILNDTKPLLAVVDLIFPREHPVAEAVHDEVVLAARGHVVSYGNATENWPECRRISEILLGLAVSQSTRTRIQDDIDVIRRNALGSTCFFCGKNPQDTAAVIEVKMHGEVNRIPMWNGSRVTWKHCSVRVPRCRACKAAHARIGNYAGAGAGIGAVGGILLGLLLGAAMKEKDAPCGMAVVSGGVLAAVGAGIAHGIARAKMPANTKPESHKNQYPAVKELQAQGWGFGEKPSGVTS